MIGIVLPHKFCIIARNALSFVILTFFLVGCNSVNANSNNRDLLDWKYSDLKLIDAVDTVEPGQDLIAAYARLEDHGLQLRMDFLELDKYLGVDLYIPIDTNPGGDTQITTNEKGNLISDIKWDYLIKQTGVGGIELLDNHYKIVNGTKLCVVYDRDQDRIIIDIISNNLAVLTSRTKFQVIIASPGADQIGDKSAPFTTDTPSPQRVKVLFSFWNTFSSSTPAQSLRSWAGAHAGSISSRHGLKYLIDAADQTNTTIFLMDLLSPQNISALDYLNVLPRIRKLADKGILGLSGININNNFGDSQIIQSTMLNNYVSQHTSRYSDWLINNDSSNLDKKSNSNLFLLIECLYYLYNNNFEYGDNDYAQFIKNNESCELLPVNSEFDPSNINLSLNCKILFVAHASDKSPLPLIMGGDLSKSILGDPNTCAQVFAYISAHPWIQVMTIQDLATSGNWLSKVPSSIKEGHIFEQMTAQGIDVTNGTGFSNVHSEIYTALVTAPQNQLTDLAWQVYVSFIEPASPTLLSLRQNYVGQIGEILAAAKWLRTPTNIQSCSLDLDYDGYYECILSNDRIFVVIEPDGGYIPFAFAIDDQGVHQVIGPSWEFIVGLSDPISWDIGAGVRADSKQVLGAFQDPFDNWNSYIENIEVGKIDLYSVDMTMRKSVTIDDDTLHIDIQNENPLSINLSIPLAIDPWRRFTAHWGDTYFGAEESSGYKWGVNSGIIIGVYSYNHITGFGFNATRKALLLPEDPNFDYSPGHYLPFPMALVEIASSNNVSVDILINP
jgi:hypothetical protein